MCLRKSVGIHSGSYVYKSLTFWFNRIREKKVQTWVDQIDKKTSEILAKFWPDNTGAKWVTRLNWVLAKFFNIKYWNSLVVLRIFENASQNIFLSFEITPCQIHLLTGYRISLRPITIFKAYSFWGVKTNFINIRWI